MSLILSFCSCGMIVFVEQRLPLTLKKCTVHFVTDTAGSSRSTKPSGLHPVAPSEKRQQTRLVRGFALSCFAYSHKYYCGNICTSRHW